MAIPIHMIAPARVQTAQTYLDFAAGLLSLEPGSALTIEERLTYDAALRCLRMYLSGEMDFGDVRPTAIEVTDK